MNVGKGWLIGLLLCTFLGLRSDGMVSERILDREVVRLEDAERVIELVAIADKRVLKVTNQGQCVYMNDLTKVNPYRLDVADVDGDGEMDIAIGVWKTTHFDTQAGPRLFLFNFRQGMLVKKWTGSQVGKSMVDYRFVKANPQGPWLLQIIDDIGEGKSQLATYQWFAFGFVRVHVKE